MCVNIYSKRATALNKPYAMYIATHFIKNALILGLHFPIPNEYGRYFHKWARTDDSILVRLQSNNLQ